jgi:two-component system nitrogen regulation response regulator GlnG
MPDSALPEITDYPGGEERAHWHMEEGLRVFESYFGFRPKGGWPSEGAVSEETMKVISNYDWPGNVRQLENICYWLTLMSPTQNVKVQDLPTEIKDYEITESPTSSWEDNFSYWIRNVAETLDKDLLNVANSKLEKIIINAALDQTNGKKNEAAILLGLGRNTLAKKIKELGI